MEFGKNLSNQIRKGLILEHLIQLFGRLHPLVVHLPIGIMIFAIGMEILSRRKRYDNLKLALPMLWGVSFATAVLACIAGYVLKRTGGYEGDTVDLHQYLGIALAATSGIMFFLVLSGKLEKCQLIIAILSALLLTGTGHLGGNLTHGEDFLTEPVMALLGKEARKPITDINKAVVYHDLIVPVLENKCYQCHNGSKQKGGLRIDSPESLMKGGENGAILEAGKAEESELYKRLLLPEHHDDHMPPKGKTQLTEEEIALIAWWINQAKADFTKTVNQVPQEEKTKIMLAHFGPEKLKTVKKESNSTKAIPSTKVVPANLEDIVALQKLGVVLTPLTPEGTFLDVNFVNVSHFSEEHMKGLLKLHEQILWLDFSGTDITDQHLQQIGKFKNLTRLSLSNTLITDEGLDQVKKLKNLLYLNLYGTAVSDKGIKRLGSCKKLKALYLWLTKTTPEGIADLKQILGDEIKINHGSASEI